MKFCQKKKPVLNTRSLNYFNLSKHIISNLQLTYTNHVMVDLFVNIII
jgi:hypothetical protein